MRRFRTWQLAAGGLALLFVLYTVFVYSTGLPFFLGFFQGGEPEPDDRPPIIISSGSISVAPGSKEDEFDKVWTDLGGFSHQGASAGSYFHSHPQEVPKRFRVKILAGGPQSCRRTFPLRAGQCVQVSDGTALGVTVCPGGSGARLTFDPPPQETETDGRITGLRQSAVTATTAKIGDESCQLSGTWRIEIAQRSR